MHFKVTYIFERFDNAAKTNIDLVVKPACKLAKRVTVHFYRYEQKTFSVLCSVMK